MRFHRTIAIIALCAFPIAGSAAFALYLESASLTDVVVTRVAAAPRKQSSAVSLQPSAPRPRVAGATTKAVKPFVPPIDEAARRITKKPFGIEIHPETSPVPDDHFNGFHVGVDFEAFDWEDDIDVPVYAICAGRLLFKKQAQGYGGVAVQRCQLEGREVTVIYGHLRLASISAEAGGRIAQGQKIGVLGTGHSEETEGVRKHLHLGLYDGAFDPLKPDIRGYVKDPVDIAKWLDAQDYIGF